MMLNNYLATVIDRHEEGGEVIEVITPISIAVGLEGTADEIFRQIAEARSRPRGSVRRVPRIRPGAENLGIHTEPRTA